MHRDISRQHPDSIDEIADAFSRPVIRGTSNDERVMRYPELVQVDRFGVVPIQAVAFVNGDRTGLRHTQERRLHLQKIAADRVGDTDNSVDTRIQIAHPRHRIKEPDSAHNPSIANNLNWQSFAGAQAVADGSVIERV